MLLELLTELLRDLGANVVPVDRADDGMRYLEKHADEVGLVVTDVMMPGQLNGHDLAVAVSERWPGLPVIMTSGYSPEQHHWVPTSAFFIAKPWTFEQMETAVKAKLPFLGNH